MYPATSSPAVLTIQLQAVNRCKGMLLHILCILWLLTYTTLGPIIALQNTTKTLCTFFYKKPLCTSSSAHLLHLETHLHLYSSLILLFLPLTLSRADNSSELHAHKVPNRLSSVVNDSSHYPSIHCPHHSSPVPNCHGNHDLFAEGGAI